MKTSLVKVYRSEEARSESELGVEGEMGEEGKGEEEWSEMYIAPPSVADMHKSNLTVFVMVKNDSGVKSAKIAPPPPRVDVH